TVTLTPRKPFKLSKPVQLRINGLAPSGMQDSSGRFIDGDHNGTAGGNAVAVLRPGGATISAMISQESPSGHLMLGSLAVDALLGKEHVTIGRHPARLKPSRR